MKKEQYGEASQVHELFPCLSRAAFVAWMVLKHGLNEKDEAGDQEAVIHMQLCTKECVEAASITSDSCR